MNFFFTFHSDIKPLSTKRQVTTQKRRRYRGMITSIVQHSYLHPKPTHALPLAWANKKRHSLKNLSMKFTRVSSKGFVCLSH
jgi:hypothetical protein